jgi:hypothetical protein
MVLLARKVLLVLKALKVMMVLLVRQEQPARKVRSEYQVARGHKDLPD